VQAQYGGAIAATRCGVGSLGREAAAVRVILCSGADGTCRQKKSVHAETTRLWPLVEAASGKLHLMKSNEERGGRLTAPADALSHAHIGGIDIASWHLTHAAFRVRRQCAIALHDCGVICRG